MRFRDPKGASPIARVELYVSLRGIANRNIRKPLLILPRYGVALRVEADIPAKIARRRWHLKTKFGPMGCWRCRQAVLEEVARLAEGRMDGMRCWRRGKGSRGTVYVHFPDGIPPFMLVALPQWKSSMNRLRHDIALLLARRGYAVTEIDGDGNERNLKPSRPWAKSRHCNLNHAAPRRLRAA